MKQLNVLVIHPNSGEEIYQQLAGEHTAIEPPLWTRLIAGYVRDCARSVSIMDMEAENISAHKAAFRVEQAKPLLAVVVAFGHQPSASTQMMPGAYRIIAAIKQHAPSIPVLLVGGHVSALPEHSLRESEADFACVGEGPLTVVDLVHHYQALDFDGTNTPLEDIGGLVWRAANGDIVVNARAPGLKPDELTGNVWDLLPMEKYRAHNWQCFGAIDARQPYASIYTSLNCSFKCSFCMISAPFGNKVYSTRDPATVVAEVEHLYRTYGVKTIKIVDEMFVLNAKHVAAVCEGLAALPFAAELNIWAYARVDTIKPSMLALMRKAGIRWLALGIESASKEVRDTARKALKSESIDSIVHAIQAAGINVIGNYIFGLPGETFASMRETLDLAKELNCEFANFYASMPYPGSQLYADAAEQGLTLPKEWSGYSQHSYDCTPLATEHLLSAEILEFRDKAFLEYFQNPVYLDSIEAKFGSATRCHLEAMTQYKLKRALLEEMFEYWDKHGNACAAPTARALLQAIREIGTSSEDGKIIYYSHRRDIESALADIKRYIRPVALGINHFIHRPLDLYKSTL